MNVKSGGALSITVKFSPETSPHICAAAAGAGFPLATWARGVLERDAGLDRPEADLTPIGRPEPMSDDELTRRLAVRRLGEIVEILRSDNEAPENVIADLREATSAIVATLPRRVAT